MHLTQVLSVLGVALAHANTQLPHERVLAWAAKHNYELNTKLSFVRTVDNATQKTEVSCVNSAPLVADEILIRVPYTNLLTDRVTVFNDCKDIGGQVLCDTLRSIAGNPEFSYHGGLAVLTVYVAISRKLNKGEFAEVLVNFPSPSDVNAAQDIALYYDDERRKLVDIFGPDLNLRVTLDRSLPSRLYAIIPEALRSVIDEEDLRWAFFLVNSRCFGVNIPGVGDAIAIIPLADYLNHHHAHIVFHREESPETKDVFTFRTMYPYEDAGMEVYGFYGIHTNAHLAMQYGFSLPINHANTVALELVDAAGTTHSMYMHADCWLNEGNPLLEVVASTGQTGHAWDLFISSIQAKRNQYVFALEDAATSAQLTPLLRSLYEYNDAHLRECLAAVIGRKTEFAGYDPATFASKDYEDPEYIEQLRWQVLNWDLHQHRLRHGEQPMQAESEQTQRAHTEL